MATRKNWKVSVLKFVDVLRREIHVDRVIVFGSRVRGTAKAYSDIDLAIFSRDFKDKDEVKNMQYLFKKSAQVDTAIEPHPYHPRDLKNPLKGSLLYEIVRTGRVVA